MVEVNTLPFDALFAQGKKIIIPEYQRPYTWTVDKAEELIQDFEEFFAEQSDTTSAYYMGSILFYHNENKNVLEVIDGQQRLSTLIVLQYVLDGALQDHKDLQFNGHTSYNAIRKIKAFFTSRKSTLQALASDHGLLKRLSFTVITCLEEDLAFTFFDTQNNRGVSLSADDYLKAYHLRSVVSEDQQDVLATEWEHAALLAQDEDHAHLSLAYLFYQMLYKGRMWKGQKHLVPEGKDELLQTFQKKTLAVDNGGSFPLYHSKSNMRYTAAKIDDGDIAWQDNDQGMDTKADLPFSMRQPLHKGYHFFAFTSKYYAIHQLLFGDKSAESAKNAELVKSRGFYDIVYSKSMSPFLCAYMQLCLILYYDVFKDKEISRAIQYFDYFIGSIRLEKYYVRKESVKNSLLEAQNNLLDVITQAYLPQEIFEFISNEPSTKIKYAKIKIEELNTIRHKYIDRVTKCYEGEVDIINRLQWIK